mgnify:CR=1 FL=1
MSCSAHTRNRHPRINDEFHCKNGRVARKSNRSTRVFLPESQQGVGQDQTVPDRQRRRSTSMLKPSCLTPGQHRLYDAQSITPKLFGAYKSEGVGIKADWPGPWIGPYEQSSKTAPKPETLVPDFGPECGASQQFCLAEPRDLSCIFSCPTEPARTTQRLA